MMAYEDALARILDHATPVEVGEVGLDAAAGRVVAGEVRSPVALPPFANSAMDGFALQMGRFAREGEIASGTRIRVVGSLPAGSAADSVPESGPGGGGDDRSGSTAAELQGEEAMRAVEIMTGAPVPSGFHTVVPVEDVEVEEVVESRPRWIRLTRPVGPGFNIRASGKDFQVGDLVLAPGRRIGAVEMAALAALGVSRLSMFRPIRVAILCTGAELVADPEVELEPGMIRNSNGPFLARRFRELGAEVVANQTLGDRIEPFLEALEGAWEAGADLVVTTGAVSRGRWDFIPEALERAHARVLFHGAAIRPGKPLLGAVFPGRGLLLGLPGNPGSVAVGMRFFVQPCLRALQARGTEVPLRLPLLEEIEKRPRFRYFVCGTLRESRGGGPGVHVLPGQRSYRLAPLLQGEVWAVLPEGPERLPADALVEVYPAGGDPQPPPSSGELA